MNKLANKEKKDDLTALSVIMLLLIMYLYGSFVVISSYFLNFVNNRSSRPYLITKLSTKNKNIIETYILSDL